MSSCLCQSSRAMLAPGPGSLLSEMRQCASSSPRPPQTAKPDKRSGSDLGFAKCTNHLQKAEVTTVLKGAWGLLATSPR